MSPAPENQPARITAGELTQLLIIIAAQAEALALLARLAGVPIPDAPALPPELAGRFDSLIAGTVGRN